MQLQHRPRAVVVAVAVAACALVTLAGCSESTPSSQGENCINKVDDNGDGLVDCADPQCSQHTACAGGGPRLDGGLPPPDVLPPKPSGAPRLQLVVDRILLPKSDKDYAIDLDNNGTKDNKLGAIVALIAAAASAVDLQRETDEAINGAVVILLTELWASSLSDDLDATMAVHRGDDRDGNPSDNFSGSETLSLHPQSPQNIRLAAQLRGGRLDTKPGLLRVPLPLIPNQPPITLTLKRARVQGDVSASGIRNGLLSGALPMTEVNDVLVPALAKLVTSFLNDPSSTQQLRDVLKIFDANKDNVVTADEIKNSIIAQALRPDVVLSGDPDRVPDSLSLGLGFSAVPCTIN